ncbi:MAG: tetraacyldisaccharide 4'-kinase [Rhodobacteraceae bacterium]|nr:tetraacyldisaccharide 4'-kinase [Paracoccaceae bacterium]
MKSPDFWIEGKARHPWALLLSPLSRLWALAAARRLRKGPWERVGVPVICVGNINAGGTGKTPTVLALAEYLAAQGVAAHVVSKGYGGQEIGPLRVNEMKHTAAQVGDEPLLMAAFCPTWVAKDRVLGAKAAIKAGAEVILLDDGFQNPALHKDLSLVVVDAEAGFGNGRVMPAGPLREPVEVGLARGDVVVSIGLAKAQAELGRMWPAINRRPRLKARLEPLRTGMDWKDQRVIAFAGIGRPAKFFKTLKEAGAEIVAAHSFADHAVYPDAVLRRLLKESRQKNAQLATTEKDAARLPAWFRPEVITLPVRLVFDDEKGLEDILLKASVLPPR